MIYFASDFHLSHKNVLVFDEKRWEQFIDYHNLPLLRKQWLSWAEDKQKASEDRDPFRNIMADAIVKHDDYIINSLMKLKEDDELYFLWDLFFLNWTKEIEAIRDRLKQVKCKMYWILWNHDEQKHVDILSECFEWVKDYFELSTHWKKFVLMHYPIESWDGIYKWTIHLHWHSHQNFCRKRLHIRETLLMEWQSQRMIDYVEWLISIKWRLDISYDWWKLLWSINDILEKLEE